MNDEAMLLDLHGACLAASRKSSKLPWDSQEFDCRVMRLRDELFRVSLSTLDLLAANYGHGRALLLRIKKRWEAAVQFGIQDMLAFEDAQVSCHLSRALLTPREALWCRDKYEAMFASQSISKSNKTQGQTSQGSAVHAKQKSKQPSRAACSSLNALACGMHAVGHVPSEVLFLQQCLAVTSTYMPSSVEAATILYDLGVLFAETRNHNRALLHFEKAWQIVSRYNANSMLHAQLCVRVGGVLHDQGAFGKALAFLKRALCISRRIAPDGLSHARVLYNTALLLLKQSRHGYNHEDNEDNEDNEDKLVGTSSDLFSGSLCFTCDGASEASEAKAAEVRSLKSYDQHLDDALRYCQEALDILRVQAPSTLEEAATLDAKGSVLQAQHRWEEALSCFKDALQVTRIHAPGSILEGMTLHNIGNIFMQQGCLDEALHCYYQALPIRLSLEKNSLRTASTLHNIGEVLRLKKRFSSALKHYEDAFAIRHDKDPGSMKEARTLSRIALILQRTHSPDKALECYQKVLVIHQAKAKNSIEEAQTLNSIGILLAGKDFAAGLSHCRRSLAIVQDQAPGSLYHALTLHNIGFVLEHKLQEHFEEALSYYQESMELVQLVGEGTPQQAVTAMRIGFLHLKQHCFLDALDYYNKALLIWQATLPGSNHEADALEGLGAVHKKACNFEAAISCFSAALVIRQQKAPSSLSCASCLRSIGSVLQQQAKLEEALTYFNKALEFLAQNS